MTSWARARASHGASWQAGLGIRHGNCCDSIQIQVQVQFHVQVYTCSSEAIIRLNSNGLPGPAGERVLSQRSASQLIHLREAASTLAAKEISPFGPVIRSRRRVPVDVSS